MSSRFLEGKRIPSSLHFLSLGISRPAWEETRTGGEQIEGFSSFSALPLCRETHLSSLPPHMQSMQEFNAPTFGETGQTPPRQLTMLRLWLHIAGIGFSASPTKFSQRKSPHCKPQHPSTKF
jgi:hypothetical protein